MWRSNPGPNLGESFDFHIERSRLSDSQPQVIPARGTDLSNRASAQGPVTIRCSDEGQGEAGKCVALTPSWALGVGALCLGSAQLRRLPRFSHIRLLPLGSQRKRRLEGEGRRRGSAFAKPFGLGKRLPLSDFARSEARRLNLVYEVVVRAYSGTFRQKHEKRATTGSNRFTSSSKRCAVSEVA